MAGDSISGDLYLELFKSYPAKELVLKFKGMEQC
jgi:hypothetical protein